MRLLAAMFMWRAPSLPTWEGEDGEQGLPIFMGSVQHHVSAPYLALNHVLSAGRRRRFLGLVCY
jgi:hypothetical protein